MGLIIWVGFIFGPGSLLVLVNYWGGFIVLSSSFFGPVSLLGCGHCVASLLWRVHCCVGLIVGPRFIVRPRSFLVIVHCQGGSIVAWFHCWCWFHC